MTVTSLGSSSLPSGTTYMDIGKELLLPEVRIEIARQSLLSVVPTLDSNNLRGLGIFGSFWNPTWKNNPNDIDLACFVLNDAIFLEDDSPKINTSLGMFHLPVQYHILTPYSVSVRHEVENLRVRLSQMQCIWGSMPEWLYK